MGQWKKVIDKTEQLVSGNSNIDIQGYVYVLVLKAFAYTGLVTSEYFLTGSRHCIRRAREIQCSSRNLPERFRFHPYVSVSKVILFRATLDWQNHVQIMYAVSSTPRNV